MLTIIGKISKLIGYLIILNLLRFFCFEYIMINLLNVVRVHCMLYDKYTRVIYMTQSEYSLKSATFEYGRYSQIQKTQVQQKKM